MDGTGHVRIGIAWAIYTCVRGWAWLWGVAGALGTVWLVGSLTMLVIVHTFDYINLSGLQTVQGGWTCSNQHSWGNVLNYDVACGGPCLDLLDHSSRRNLSAISDDPVENKATT